MRKVERGLNFLKTVVKVIELSNRDLRLSIERNEVKRVLIASDKMGGDRRELHGD